MRVFWLGGAQVSAISLTLLSHMVLGRLLGPVQYGLFSVVVSMGLGVALLGGLGMPNVLTKLFSNTGRTRQLSSGALRSMLILTICLTIVFGAGAWLFGMGPRGATEGMYAGLVAVALARLLTSLGAESLRGLDDLFGTAWLTAGLPHLILIVGSLAFGVFGLQVWTEAALWVFVVAMALVLFGIVGRLQRLGSHIDDLRGDTEKPMAVVIGLGVPFGLFQFAAYAITQLDLWVVGHIFSGDGVGQYAVATKTAVLLGVPLLITTQSTVRSMARIGEDESILSRQLGRLSLLGFIGSALAAAVLWLFGGALLAATFGKPYTAALGPLLILCIGQVVNTATGPSAMLLLMQGRHWTVAGISVIGLFIQAVVVAVGAILYPSIYVLASVAAASLSAYSIVLAVYAFRLTGVKTWMGWRK